MRISWNAFLNLFMNFKVSGSLSYLSPHCLSFLCQQQHCEKKTLSSHKTQCSHCTPIPNNRQHIRQRCLAALFNTFASNMPRYTCKYDRCLADNKRRRGDDTSSSYRVESVIVIGTYVQLTVTVGVIFDFRVGSRFFFAPENALWGKKWVTIRVGYDIHKKWC